MYGNRDNRSGRSQPKFQYQKRTAEDVQERASRRISDFDSIYSIPVRNFKAKQGENLVRFLPPTWANAKHYGYDIFIHRNVGADTFARYLCRKSMLGERCPICDERNQLAREGATEEAAELKAQPRVISWIINRDNESEGPMIWEMSPGQDIDIATLQTNKRTGHAFLCDDPEEGFDLQFVREGTTLKNTRYRGWQFSRQSSPISDDEAQQEQWLEYIAEHPIADILKFYDPKYIEELFTGKVEPAPEPERSTVRNSRPAVREVEKEVPQQTVAEELDDEIPFEKPVVSTQSLLPAKPNGSNGADEDDEPAPPPRRQRASSKPVEVEEEVEEDAPPEDQIAARLKSRLARLNDRRTP